MNDLPPVTSGEVGSYLGMPLTGTTGAIGVLCVFDPEPREWSESDVSTLRELAVSVVTALELSALVRDYENDRVRWGMAIDAARIGTFDWDLVTGRLIWDDRLIAMFGYEGRDLDESIEAFTRASHPDDRARVADVLRELHRPCGEYDAEYRIVRPDGDTRWVQARGRPSPATDGRAVRLLGAAQTRRATHR